MIRVNFVRKPGTIEELIPQDQTIIEKELNCEIYFCDTFCAWQKGSNENTNGLLREFFPKGVVGTLAMVKDGSGALGTIMNNGIAGQARWIPVDEAICPTCFEVAFVAVAVLVVTKQIKDIKDGQKAIIDILERDKKSQLLADFDLLVAYMDEYQYYWENEASLIANLNQVKNIKRNSMKDIRSYLEQIEGMVSDKNSILKMKSSSSKIGQILDRFVHYKLALHVFALSEYMEVMLSKNFQREYLEKISDEIKKHDIDFIDLYGRCYKKIELLKTEAVTTQAASKLANVSRSIGKLFGKITSKKDNSIDEFLSKLGDTISESERKRLEKTLMFFEQYNDSGLTPVAEHIDTINQLANKPVVMLYNKNEMLFYKLKDA